MATSTIIHSPTKIRTFLVTSVVVLVTLYSLEPFLDDEQFSYISIPSYIIIPGILAAFAIFVGIKDLHDKKSKTILLFSIGLTFWFVAEVIWIVYEAVLYIDPYPSIADVFYLSGYPFFFAFLLSYLNPIKKSITKNVFLFSIVVSSVFLIPTALVTIDQLNEEPPLGLLLGIAYPILSTGLLFLALLGTIFFIKGNFTDFWILIFVGFLINSITDTLFVFTIIDDSYYDGHITDILYLIGYFFYFFGLVSYFKIKDLQDPLKKDIIAFETIGKFAIPLIVGTIFTITSISLMYFYYYNADAESNLVFVLLGAFVIMIVFSAMILLINKNLGNIVRLKTNELENQKEDLKLLLEEKTTEAEQSSEFSKLGKNLTEIVHDLKNPLTVLKLNVEMLEKSGIEDEVLQNRVKSMNESISLMTDQIQDILNYIQERRIETEAVSLNQLLDKALKNVALPKQITVSIPQTDIPIKCDPTKMQFVFMNILSNAIQAMENRGKITITSKQLKKHIQIDFSNSGPSIPDDLLEKIFEPLFSTKPKGTGLGLATCRKVILQHHGNIYAKNNPTTFTIELPK